jgi:hypothetical protein
LKPELGQAPPIIVKLIEPRKDTLYDVLFGALGLTGVLVLLALLAAIAFGALLFWIRRRQS